MGLRNLLRKWFPRGAPPAPPPPPVPETPPPPRDPLEALQGLAPAEAVARALDLVSGEAPVPGAMALVQHLREACTQAGLPAALRLRLADCFVQRGETERGLKVLRALAEGAIADAAPALLQLGDLALQSGDLAQARRWFEAVLAIDLEYPGARERLARTRRPVRAGGAGATLLAPDASVGLGRFALLRELGRGGAGAVFLARDRGLDREVALKIYHPQARGGRDVRLRSEARTAAAIGSSYVVRVLDLYEELGALAMEHTSGGSLRVLIARHGTAAGSRAGLLLDVARALARTHAQGWVHRDVKPGNVLLRADGQALLTDFGLALRRGEPTPPQEGTPGYLAPEAQAGAPADPRMDVFAFGSLVRDLAGEGDPRLRDLAGAALDPDPARRPADGTALVAWLLRTRAPA